MEYTSFCSLFLWNACPFVYGLFHFLDDDHAYVFGIFPRKQGKDYGCSTHFVKINTKWEKGECILILSYRTILYKKTQLNIISQPSYS